MKLGLKALSNFLGKDFNIERIDGAFITLKDKRYTKLSRSDIEKYLNSKKK